MGLLCLSLFCYALLCVLPSFAIILTMKKELVALLLLFCRCIATVNVLFLFVTLPWGRSTVYDCGTSLSYSFTF